MKNLQRFIEVGDSGGVETIWTCCVTCLGHLTALSHLIGQREPTLLVRGSMDDLYDLTLEKLGDLSREVPVEVYSHFDVLTQVRISLGFAPDEYSALTKDADQISWKRALDTIEARIRVRSPAESKSLRYWRGVIGKVHADFETNLLGCGPSTLMSLALLEDGRTADSKFPNLLLHGEREPFGL